MTSDGTCSVCNHTPQPDDDYCGKCTTALFDQGDGGSGGGSGGTPPAPTQDNGDGRVTMTVKGKGASGTHIAGDSVEGDKVEGDKVEGDKVAGHKFVGGSHQHGPAATAMNLRVGRAHRVPSFAPVLAWVVLGAGLVAFLVGGWGLVSDEVGFTGPPPWLTYLGADPDMFNTRPPLLLLAGISVMLLGVIGAGHTGAGLRAGWTRHTHGRWATQRAADSSARRTVKPCADCRVCKSPMVLGRGPKEEVAEGRKAKPRELRMVCTQNADHYSRFDPTLLPKWYTLAA